MIPVVLLAAVSITSETPSVHYRQPQLAVRDRQVAATFGAGGAVYFAGSSDGGRSFSKPVKVGEAKVLALGHRRGPRIAFAGSAIVISAAVAEKGGGADGSLVAWRSTDGGKSWSAPATINDVAASAREGMHAMAAGPKGMLYAAWLDLRRGRTDLYGARSTDGGVTWSKNVLIYQSPDGNICECCHPSVAVDAKGGVYAMWRNWIGGARDMYLARSSDGGLSFGKAEKLGDGTWPLRACPMDGGAVAVDASGQVVTVWRRAGEVFLARPGQPEKLLGPGKDPWLAAGSDGVYAVWTSAAGVQLLRPGKTEPQTLTGAFPTLAAGSPVVAAWEDHGAIKIDVLR